MQLQQTEPLSLVIREFVSQVVAHALVEVICGVAVVLAVMAEPQG